MAQIRLIHWKAEEAEERAALLRKAGYQVNREPFEGPASLRVMGDDPPAAVVIDLSRLPSQGRDVALVIRHRKTTRALPLVMAGGKEEKEGGESDPHLRSTREVIGYHIQARDGETGHLEDLIVDDESWFIRYLVIDTRNWLPGRKVLVAPAWAEQVDWVARKIHLDLSRETIRNSPKYDPSMPVNREYEI